MHLCHQCKGSLMLSPYFRNDASVYCSPGTCCKSKTGRHNQDRSRRSTNHRRILTRPVLTVATGLGSATRPWRMLVLKLTCEWSVTSNCLLYAYLCIRYLHVITNFNIKTLAPRTARWVNFNHIWVGLRKSEEVGVGMRNPTQDGRHRRQSTQLQLAAQCSSSCSSSKVSRRFVVEQMRR